ncbi:MAG: hypothetical protein GXO96_09295 [Nitrospirae bacterium]|nr:hypothetical protein [Candidatus Manganitrophaceae bacterium]
MSIKIKTLFILFFMCFPVITPHEAFSRETTQKRIEKKDLFLKFKKGETLKGVIINGPDLIEIIKISDHDIRIEDSIIEQGLDFTNIATVQNKIEVIRSEIKINQKTLYAVKVKATHFRQSVSFSKTLFKGKTSFSGASFDQMALFNEATFNEKSVFALTRFKDIADFSGTNFKGETIFDLAFFKKNTSFWSATFDKKVSFILTTFEDKASFKDAVFFENTFFPSATFNELADFTRSTFHKLAHFMSAVFEKRLTLSMIDFRAYVDFRDTIIGQLDFNSTESPAIILGRMDFRRAIISEAHFQDIFFEQDIDFSDAIFIRVFFKDVSFEQDAYFLRTRFRLQTALYDTRFKKAVDFTDADLRSNQQFLISYTFFNHLKITWQQLPPLTVWQNNVDKKMQSFLDIERKQQTGDKKKENRVKLGGIEKLSHVVSSLQTSFRASRQLQDANHAYYDLKTLELNKSRQGKTAWQWFSAQPAWAIWWASTGFGMQLGWISLWCFGINLFFTLLYFLGGQLSNGHSPKTGDVFKVDDTFKLRVLDFPKRYYVQSETTVSPGHLEYSVRRFLSLFCFSAVILMKVGYRNYNIKGKFLGRFHYRWIIRLEWLLGLYLLPALSYTLQNVVPVVNKLVTGVF